MPGWGRSASGYGSGGYGSGYSNRSGYLNREYNADEGRGFGSVSYTHLDVYKRQPMGLQCSITAIGSVVLQLSLIHI